MCRSAARSYLSRVASETRVAWNRADPSFDASRLVLTNQNKSRGELLRPQVETSKLADLNEDDNLKLSQLSNVLLLLLAFPSLTNVAASTPTAKQHQINRLNRKTRWIKPFWQFVLASRDFAVYGAAHAELLCVCCWCASADVGSVYLSLCLCCRLAPTLAAVY